MFPAKISMLIRAILNNLFHHTPIHLHSLSQVMALDTLFSSTGHKCLSGHRALIFSRRKNKAFRNPHISHKLCGCLPLFAILQHYCPCVFSWQWTISPLVVQSCLQLSSQPSRQRNRDASVTKNSSLTATLTLQLLSRMRTGLKTQISGFWSSQFSDSRSNSKCCVMNIHVTYSLLY